MNELSLTTIDTEIDIRPDQNRLLLRFFVPGNEDVGPGDSRASAVIDRILRLTPTEVTEMLSALRSRFTHRHIDLNDCFTRHAELAAKRLDPGVTLTDERFLVLGAAFSLEYAIEGAALCNPSIVALPSTEIDGTTRFVLSQRGVGEGHRSSIGFRTGTVSADGDVTLDSAGIYPRMGLIGQGLHARGVVHRKLSESDDDHENASYVLDPLPDRFTDEQLVERLEALSLDAATRRNTDITALHLRKIAESSYSVRFTEDIELPDRVLWPHAPDESHGMEDARFVEITDGSAPRYCATYTAFDGANINQYLLTTDDFESFEMGPMAGSAARGKGLALFPRQIGGRFAALSRADRETNALSFSDDLRCWDDIEQLQSPERPWEVIQLGNCGSPIETEFGWLVLTHGVGPMRTYSIGAVLLDIDNPVRVIGSTPMPIITPRPDQQNGYVPNVVYTCGALAVGDRLIIPYGVGDHRITISTASISELCKAMM
jgi:predicted GH43/DUF377 family glycosyl hydrolase